MALWPEAVDAHMAGAEAAYCRMMAADRGSPELQRWSRAYRRYVFAQLPAQLTAIAHTAAPRHVERRIHVRSAAADAFPPGAIIALSRTGVSFAIPWLLARRGADITVIADPADRARQLMAAITGWPMRGTIDFLAADRGTLVRARRALQDGRYVVVYPEFTAPSQHDVVVPFLGSKHHVSPSAAALACLTRTPVVPACGYLVGRDIAVDAAEPLLPSRFADAGELNAAMFARLSAWAREHADQWLGWEYLARTAPATGNAT